jgi:hypothetical protein
MTRETYGAVTFDLLTALLDSWSLGNRVTDSLWPILELV